MSGKTVPDLKELRRLAETATAGNWLHRYDPGNPAGVQHGVKLSGEFGAWICDCLDNADRVTEGGVAGECNAAFIAAANPKTVLELLDRIAELERAVLAAQPQAGGDGAKDAHIDLKDRVDELVEQHGSLRAAGRAIMVDHAYLSRLASGDKASPTKDVLKRMGLIAITVIVYERAAIAAGKHKGE